ncbi:S9 family peptidase [Psychromicrobium lacuslunae]|uniref:Peptidase S9 n=1 Tax=Psychromicrobium lacuslunae TaxID=1618207 RepID=A0A0D4BWV4_9MICC|nr:S9 family peptidase [Psychromicrobium lacuslunae]AJT40947.1 peptidase S9 [Psychromicrobium lacuslunae]
MKPEQLSLIQTLSAPSLHPDGTRAVVASSRPDFAADSYVGQLWELRLDGTAEPRRITRGFRDSAPQYSPDGSALAFLRATPDSAAQLYLVEAAGGEPQKLTDQLLGVNSFRWSPDSASLLFSAAVAEAGRYGTVTGVDADAEDPRLITGYKYRLNGEGFTEDKAVQLFELTVPALGAEPPVEPRARAKQAAAGAEFQAVPIARQLTEDRLSHSNPRYSADGSLIYFTAERLDSADGCTELFSMPAEGGARRQLSNQPFSGFSVSAAIESADGKWLFALAEELGPSGTDFVASQVGIYLSSTAEPGRWRRLTDAESMDFAESTELVACADGGVLALERRRGAQRLVKVTASGEIQILVDEPLLVTGVATNSYAMVLTFTDALSFGDVAVLSEDGLQRLSDFSASLRAEAKIAVPREHSFESADGYPVHGWLLLPEGAGPHPVLLNIHGGPFAQYGWGAFDEAQVYLAAGYAVLMCNPRGAAGYGRSHARAIKGAMGSVDLADVLGFLEGALAAYPELSAERLGVMGGSYGGYLTAWAISQDQRFSAAIVERGYLDPVSFVGSSDIGWIFPSEYNGLDPVAISEQSPMAQIASVRTPTLVLHSEQDWRCPLEQAQRYYVALKKQGVETELLIFPGENHELSRSGRPHHRRQRFEHILRWWARQLPSAANPGESIS